MASVRAEAYRIPTETPESDGTLEWDHTGLLVVHADAAGHRGMGFSYTHPAAARIVEDTLAPAVLGADALAPPAAWQAMRTAVRNIGRQGVASAAMAAVDVALWDLAARLAELPVVTLLGRARDTVPVYGSGGFTSYPTDRLREQLASWVDEGMTMVKMKIGRRPDSDAERVAAARDAIGPQAALFVDANGAFTRKRALEWMWLLHERWGVSWFEEPVSSNDLEGLRLARDQGPPGMEVAAGEYGWDLSHFRDMLAAGAVDTLQVDVTRCGGYTEFLRVAALADAHETPLSAHTAPALHAPVMCAIRRGVHVEWFHDHARIEGLLFEGAPRPDGGALRPDPAAPGLGLELKRQDAEVYRVA